MKDPNRRHAKLDAIAPWRRREHARKTGDKCERSQLSRSYRKARRADRDREEQKRFKEEKHDTT